MWPAKRRWASGQPCGCAGRWDRARTAPRRQALPSALNQGAQVPQATSIGQRRHRAQSARPHPISAPASTARPSARASVREAAWRVAAGPLPAAALCPEVELVAGGAVAPAARLAAAEAKVGAAEPACVAAAGAETPAAAAPPAASAALVPAAGQGPDGRRPLAALSVEAPPLGVAAAVARSQDALARPAAPDGRARRAAP
jgi:hypothetical protein